MLLLVGVRTEVLLVVQHRLHQLLSAFLESICVHLETQVLEGVIMAYAEDYSYSGP